MVSAEELATKGAKEVRYSPALYRAFQFHYKAHSGRNCKPCSFNNDFAAFKRMMDKPTIITPKKKAMSSNTFTLKNPKDRIYVPFNKGTVITSESPDEDVVIYLTQKGNFVDIDARKARFIKLPDAMLDNSEDTPDSELSLKKLRKKYPEISARSREDFLAQL